MAIFHHPFTNVENYPIVSPLSLIISFNNPTKDHPHTGGKDEIFLRSLNDQMPDAGRQIWKVRVPKDVKLTPLEDKNEQEQTKNAEKGIKKIYRESKKNEKNERWTKGQRTMIFRDPWSNYPKTQVGPTYPFFRNPESRPTLRT